MTVSVSPILWRKIFWGVKKWYRHIFVIYF